MATYLYRGRSQRGELILGELDADTADAVASQLFNSGITPINIDVKPAARQTVAGLWRRLTGDKPKLDDLILFARQMHTLVKAGVPLVRGLTTLEQSSHNEMLKVALREVVDSLESGRELSAAMGRHPQVFSSLFVNVVRVGENSGNLEEAFIRMYNYLSLEKDIRTRIKTAFRYPIFVVSAIVVAMAVITLFVVPRFAAFFKAVRMQLPLPTRVIMAVSEFAQDYWWLVLLVSVAAVFLFRRYINTEHGRYRWDGFKMRLPVIGSIIMQATLARYARAFALCYRSGVPLVQALTLVSYAVDNVFMAERVLQMRTGVERGESLTRTSRAVGVFTPLVIQMLSVGEESGNVSEMLDEVGGYYEREVDYELHTLSTNIEPVLLVILGAMVLILALGVFLPMWNLAANASHL
ncbi:MAG: type II secretion system F family protein [Gammaproteobacteria bacterium]|nr:type II secretion system F family protein [Gammaproteobacteria bacterium]